MSLTGGVAIVTGGGAIGSRQDPQAIPAEAHTRVGKTRRTTEELDAMWDRLRAERGMPGRKPAPGR